MATTKAGEHTMEWAIALRVEADVPVKLPQAQRYQAFLMDKCRQELKRLTTDELSVKNLDDTTWLFQNEGKPPATAQVIELCEALFLSVATVLKHHQAKAIFPVNTAEWPLQTVVHYSIKERLTEEIDELLKIAEPDQLLITYDFKNANRLAPRYGGYLSPTEGSTQLKGNGEPTDFQLFGLDVIKGGIEAPRLPRVPKPADNITHHEFSADHDMDALRIALGSVLNLVDFLGAEKPTELPFPESGDTFQLRVKGKNVTQQLFIRYPEQGVTVITEVINGLGPYKQMIYRWQLDDKVDETAISLTISRTKKSILSRVGKTYLHLLKKPWARIGK